MNIFINSGRHHRYTKMSWRKITLVCVCIQSWWPQVPQESNVGSVMLSRLHRNFYKNSLLTEAINFTEIQCKYFLFLIRVFVFIFWVGFRFKSERAIKRFNLRFFGVACVKPLRLTTSHCKSWLPQGAILRALTHVSIHWRCTEVEKIWWDALIKKIFMASNNRKTTTHLVQLNLKSYQSKKYF